MLPRRSLLRGRPGTGDWSEAAVEPKSLAPALPSPSPAWPSRRAKSRYSSRPVLKHGPRSPTCMRVNGRSKPTGAMKVIGPIPRSSGRPRAPGRSDRLSSPGRRGFPPAPARPARLHRRRRGGRRSGTRHDEGSARAFTGGRRPDVSAGTQSIDVGTRKIVNYAWPG